MTLRNYIDDEGVAEAGDQLAGRLGLRSQTLIVRATAGGYNAIVDVNFPRSMGPRTGWMIAANGATPAEALTNLFAEFQRLQLAP